jgi:thiamine kinase-like enzyme
MPLVTIDKIRGELASSGKFSQECVIQPIQGGAINQSYQLLDNGNHYFVKAFSADPVAIIDRATQFAQLRYLASAGFASTPIYLSQQQSFQVDNWVESPNLLHCGLTSEQQYRLLAQSLAKIHTLANGHQLKLAPLDLPAAWLHYIDLIGTKLTAGQLDNMLHMADYWRHETNAESTVCHNDLALQHVTMAKLVFDWEYSAYSCRYFDIAACLTVNNATPRQAQLLISEYAKVTGLAAQLLKDKVAKMQPLFTFTNQLWCTAADKMHK